LLRSAANARRQKRPLVTSYRVLCSLALPSAPAHHRAPGICRRGSMFHPLDTGPFKLVVLRGRPTRSKLIRDPDIRNRGAPIRWHRTHNFRRHIGRFRPKAVARAAPRRRDAIGPIPAVRSSRGDRWATKN
jgi:hypothetical protein